MYIHASGSHGFLDIIHTMSSHGHHLAQKTQNMTFSVDCHVQCNLTHGKSLPNTTKYATFTCCKKDDEKRLFSKADDAHAKQNGERLNVLENTLSPPP
jgi:hypothetical protein